MHDGKDINRKWLHKIYRNASQQSDYFAGTNPREIAFSIVRAEDMHPCFVGKLDELLTKMVADGSYKIADGQLRRCERTMASTAAPAVARRRQIVEKRRRTAKLSKQGYRDFANDCLTEAYA